MTKYKFVSSVLLLAAGGCSLLGQTPWSLGDSGSCCQEHSLEKLPPDALFAEGYDGADLKAMDAAWDVFAKTKGLKGSELDMQNYWFTIEMERTYRVVEIYPKPRPENEPEPPELPMASDHWLWGTEGVFWVNKATFEVDRKFVYPTDR